ncbi:MAG: zinc metallopeptidase [Firmicutes bacterium]|nr:zinc metallopeptidase [Bacillota bacterium]
MDLYYLFSGGNVYITIIMVVTLLFSFYAQYKVKSTFNNYKSIPNSKNITGEMLALELKNKFQMSYLGIERVGGYLSDHYNPKSKSLGLSQEVANKSTVASLAIVAHEMGHAKQDADNMLFLKLRNNMFPITNIASNMAIPIFFFGLIFNSNNLMNLGIILFALVSLFYVITLPIEINASKRGLNMLKEGQYLNEGEIKGARAVLSAAALTYIAALASSVATLLRLMFLRSRND